MTNHLFDNAVIDRYARMVNGLDVEPELVFADRLLLLATYPAVRVPADAELDSFMDRVRVWKCAEVAS